MSNSPSSAGEERATTPAVISSQSSPKARFWLRELPYAAVFVLAIFGIAYNTYSKQSIVGYWELLALVICVVCIGSGWPHAHDKKARLRLVWTQALHWLAFLFRFQDHRIWIDKLLGLLLTLQLAHPIRQCPPALGFHAEL